MKLTKDETALVLATISIALEHRDDKHNRQPAHKCRACGAWDQRGQHYNELCDGCAGGLRAVVRRCAK